MTGDLERGVGMECYGTVGGPCSCRVKAYPEDFGVEEQISLAEMVGERRAGYFPLYRVEKRGIDTMHMGRELSRGLKSRVSYGGLKDKRAVATQYATPTSLRSAVPQRVEGAGFAAELVGYLPRPLSRGSVEGNRFAVKLRDCCADVEERIREAFTAAEERKVPNYYGLQRFGASGPGTHRVGEALVKGEFEEAVRVMVLGERGADGDGGKALRDSFAAGRYGEVASLLPPGRDVERAVARRLGADPGGWVKALRAVPVRLRRLYVHAYQSVIFNKTLSRAIVAGEDISRYRPGDNWAEPKRGGLGVSAPRGVRDAPVDGAVPMVQVAGYAFRDYGSRFDGYLKEALKEEGVAPGRFYVRGMEEVSSEGGFRRPHLPVEEPSWRVEGRTAEIAFTLPRGGYATVLLREIIKPEDPLAAGLG